MSRKVRIPRAARRSGGVGDSADDWLQEQMGSTFQSNMSSRSQPKQLMAVRSKKREDYRENDDWMKMDGRKPEMRAQQPREPPKPAPTARAQKKKVESSSSSSASDGDGYSDDGFEDYGEDDFEDDTPSEDPASKIGEPEDSCNTDSAGGKVSEGTTSKPTLRFPTKRGVGVKPGSNAGFGGSGSATGKKEELYANPARARRIRELKNIIGLVDDGGLLFSLAPLQPYDLYARRLGSKTWKQANIMTNEDARTTDTQTIEIFDNDASVQVPDDLGYDDGGNGSTGGNKGLSDFLSRVVPVIETSLDENVDQDDYQNVVKTTGRQAEGSHRYSSHNVLFGTPSFLANRKLTAIGTSLTSATAFVSCHSAKHQPSSSDREKLAGFNASLAGKGLACVWQADRPSHPIKTLICEGRPTCCAMSPIRPNMVFVGTETGSLNLWDLREPNSIHEDEESRALDIPNGIRRPSYCTDAHALRVDPKKLLETQHYAPIVAIIPLGQGGDGSKSLKFGGQDQTSFQIASLDESGIILLWTVLELLGMGDSSTSVEADLGLGIGSRIKLAKTGRIDVTFPTMESRAFAVFPNDSSHLIVGTGNGSLIHKSRFASSVTPRVYDAGMGTDMCANVTAIDFNPFLSNLFLVGLSDGALVLYKNDSGAPMTAWSAECTSVGTEDIGGGMPAILTVKWSKTRPAVFFVLDDAGRVHVWDLLVNQNGPLYSEPVPNPTDIISAIDLSSCQIKGTKPHLFTANESGEITKHLLSEEYEFPRENEADELEATLNFLCL
jgi:WD repeat-containing protein 60